jgi:hypothetical protein
MKVWEYPNICVHIMLDIENAELFFITTSRGKKTYAMLTSVPQCETCTINETYEQTWTVSISSTLGYYWVHVTRSIILNVVNSHYNKDVQHHRFLIWLYMWRLFYDYRDRQGFFGNNASMHYCFGMSTTIWCNLEHSLQNMLVPPTPPPAAVTRIAMYINNMKFYVYFYIYSEISF